MAHPEAVTAITISTSGVYAREATPPVPRMTKAEAMHIVRENLVLRYLAAKDENEHLKARVAALESALEFLIERAERVA